MFKNYNDYKTNRKKIEFIKLPNIKQNTITKCSIAIIIPRLKVQ